MAHSIERSRYVQLYGPTVGDSVRLGDTNLWAKVEQDYCVGGDELVFGAGKTMRGGTGCDGVLTAADGVLDLVVTNALIIDTTLGVVKADIGIKNGRIVGLGKAGDPNIMDGVTDGLIVGVNTDVRAAEGLIVTAGAIDCHVHFIDPGQVEEALSAGVTTLMGGGLGPTTVPIASTGTTNLGYMLQAAEAFPVNFGFIAKAASHEVEPLLEQLAAGAAGLKIHEDWGATPTVIDAALKAAEIGGGQIQLHTDTLNESGFVEHTIRAIAGRSIHAYHVEGAGGGHSPDIIRMCGKANILPSSTNPTNPFTINTFDEHFDMAMTSHHLNPRLPEDVAFAESRIRKETIGAEDVLHDIGAISAIGSDSQGMGRIGETISRCWQLADHMRELRGPLKEDYGSGADNFRIRRYLAKYTINPARMFGIDAEVGSIETGKLADLVFWKPHSFGVKPELIMKSGFPVWAPLGEANASLMSCEPLRYRPMWGYFGRAPQALGVRFVSPAAIASGVARRLDLKSAMVPVADTRGISKTDMLLNDVVPDINVDADTFQVSINGQVLTSKPLTRVTLGQSYMLK
ncbi:urease subunit alpha 1 [Vreelandella aquamarina]|jgi:urease subunit alpha|uniref:Urease subunit alpha n=1 Tax=Vreelandella aquamarina TaxID=77097 RepID=A0A6F8XGB8_9GAMM|nr:urease subunit alpha [Halomonas meridiana]BCB73019.1 urease subunit alpha 1 [Halomonas meridiana]|tara:strand:+ start:8546 stop:10261 length:1716 start_codon:yes stop_codon:yes gene_type:complete